MCQFLNSKRVHRAPWLSIADHGVLARFLDRAGIGPRLHAEALINAVADAFKRFPYENLTKILKSSAVVSPRSALRLPDEVIGDFLAWGTGGTCFSLTASMIAVYDAVGVEAHPILADRRYGVDTHCGLVIVSGQGELALVDPGFLLNTPVKVSLSTPMCVDRGDSRVELHPVKDTRRLELFTVVKTNRKLRLTFKIDPVDEETFRVAWERSFAFEMMNYPVLTRRVGLQQHYLQGTMLTVRGPEGVRRSVLSPQSRIESIAGLFGIDREITIKALKKVGYGVSEQSMAG